MNKYSQIAKYYDSIYPLSLVEHNFYQGFCYSDWKVLDMGCGTGRVSRILSLNNPLTEFTCVDHSIEMLGILDKNKKDNVITIHDDMRKFDPSEKYDLIIYPMNSIQCIPKIEIRNQLLRSKQWLSSNGILIVTYFNPVKHIGKCQDKIETINSDDKNIFLVVNANYIVGPEYVIYTKRIHKSNKYGFIEETLSEQIKLANLDYDFMESVHIDTGLTLESFLDQSTYGDANRDSDGVIAVYMKG